MLETASARGASLHRPRQGPWSWFSGFTDATRENRSATRWAGRSWEGIPWRGTVRETQPAGIHMANLNKVSHLQDPNDFYMRHGWDVNHPHLEAYCWNYDITIHWYLMVRSPTLHMFQAHCQRNEDQVLVRFGAWNNSTSQSPNKGFLFGLFLPAGKLT